MSTESLIRSYYDRFNAKDIEGFLELLTDDVIHEISQGDTQVGKAEFGRFMQHMNGCYEERVYELEVMVNSKGDRAAAEFMLEGVYLKQDGELPPAHGQRYSLRVGAFFELKEGKVARVANHYNKHDWVRQVIL